LLNKIFSINFLPERFIEKNRKWIFKNTEKLSKIKKKNISQKDWKKNKEKYLKIAQKKVEEFNKFYNFSYKNISIRDQKSRWGSCSEKGNLNFNYRVFLLPEKEMDYIIIHEICHLKEMNHSWRFWNLVVQKSPNYKCLRKNLKKYVF
jgi:predicted metal-dependent hydrolase